MANKIPVTSKALATAKAAAVAIDPTEPTQQGHPRLTGSARKAVVLAAIQALDNKERAQMAACNNEEIHRAIASILDHAKCLLNGSAYYLSRVEKEYGWDNHAPSVIGPAFVRRAIEKMANPTPAPAAPKLKKGEKASATSAKAKPAPKGKAPVAAAKPKKAPPKRAKPVEAAPVEPEAVTA